MDKKVLSAFFMGLSLGVGIGTLFAPNSGRKTRGLIKDTAGEGAEYLKKRGAEIQQTAEDWVDKGREALSR